MSLQILHLFRARRYKQIGVERAGDDICCELWRVRGDNGSIIAEVVNRKVVSSTVATISFVWLKKTLSAAITICVCASAGEHIIAKAPDRPRASFFILLLDMDIPSHF
jgi:hypothetical protein